MVRKHPHYIQSEMFTSDGQCASELSMKDFEAEKVIFDDAILSSDYDVITSIVWNFPGEANFAMTGAEIPNYDFCGNQIQDLSDRENALAHIYYNVFPENGKMVAIISWLRQNDQLFASLRSRLETCSDVERKNFINSMIPAVAENLVVRPSSWDNLP